MLTLHTVTASWPRQEILRGSYTSSMNLGSVQHYVCLSVCLPHEYIRLNDFTDYHYFLHEWSLFLGWVMYVCIRFFPFFIFYPFKNRNGGRNVEPTSSQEIYSAQRHDVPNTHPGASTVVNFVDHFIVSKKDWLVMFTLISAYWFYF